MVTKKGVSHMKKVKTYTVAYQLANNEERPSIKLSGKWLEKLGFKVGSKLKVYEGKDILLLVKEN